MVVSLQIGSDTEHAFKEINPRPKLILFVLIYTVFQLLTLLKYYWRSHSAWSQLPFAEVGGELFWDFSPT